MLEQVRHFLDVDFLINTFGYPGLFGIVFAETGLFFGFFFPGDSLLIAAGIFAAKGVLSIPILIPLLFIAATLGNIVGYFFGHKIGKRIFNREDSLLFHKNHVRNAQAFYHKHGGKAIIIARFIPIIRTFAPIVAGMADMHYSTFLIYNLIGSLLWAVGLTFVGFFVGQLIPDKYFEPIILFVILLSISPALYHAVNTKEKRTNLFAGLKRLLRGKI